MAALAWPQGEVSPVNQGTEETSEKVMSMQVILCSDWVLGYMASVPRILLHVKSNTRFFPA